MVQNIVDENKQKSVIQSFVVAEESILYALSISKLLLNDYVNKYDFQAASDECDFLQKIDWVNNIQNFKEKAHYLPLALTDHAIAICEEGYFDLYDGKIIFKDINSDLYAAQTIFRIIRNSLNHPYVNNMQVKIRWNVRNVKYQEIHEVKELGIILDTNNLDGKDFTMDAIGGLKNFIKLLNYLKVNI